MLLLVLLISDLIAVALSFILSFYIRKYVPLLSPLGHGLDIYLNAWPALFLWPLMLWREGLYPGFWLYTREELRKTFIATSMAGLLAMSATFVTKTGPQFSRPILVGGLILTVVFIPGLRFTLKILLRHIHLTGPAAVILGAGDATAEVLKSLRRQRFPALKIAAIFDDDPKNWDRMVEGVKVIGPIERIAEWAKARGINIAILSLSAFPGESLPPEVEAQIRAFPVVMAIPSLSGLSADEVSIHKLQESVVLELRQNLLLQRNRVAKRLQDVVLTVLVLPFAAPLLLLVSLAIALESGRPIYFAHERIGRGGVKFIAWKFRTMVKDSDRVLKEALASNPTLRAEWEAKQKLQRDPRLATVGRFLRRLSIDELPQIWNVLRGEMSWVGPRPITEREIPRYGRNFELYTQVAPGLTGLWQVSGRSDLSYTERVWLDTHYVRHWSIWLDLVIIARTFWVLLAGVGAY